MAADGFSPGGKAARVYLNLVLRLRIYGTIPPLPMHLQIIMLK
jgi:hypothetical protein